MSLLGAFFATLASISFTHYLAVLVVFVTLAFWYAKKDVGKFEAKGLKSVKPHFFYGNNKELFNETESVMDFHLNWYRKFPNER